MIHLQDGPSFESRLYLNVTLRYLGHSDPKIFGPCNLGTLGLPEFRNTFLLHHLLILPPSMCSSTQYTSVL